MAYPSKGDMIDLVNGLCLIQDRIQAERAFDFMKDPKLSNVEALKVPMFYVWSRLYGHTHTLPEYLSECMRLLREGDIKHIYFVAETKRYDKDGKKTAVEQKV